MCWGLFSGRGCVLSLDQMWWKRVTRGAQTFAVIVWYGRPEHTFKVRRWEFSWGSGPHASVCLWTAERSLACSATSPAVRPGLLFLLFIPVCAGLLQVKGISPERRVIVFLWLRMRMFLLCNSLFFSPNVLKTALFSSQREKHRNIRDWLLSGSCSLNVGWWWRSRVMVV